jgi:hypothetical protein
MPWNETDAMTERPEPLRVGRRLRDSDHEVAVLEERRG